MRSVTRWAAAALASLLPLAGLRAQTPEPQGTSEIVTAATVQQSVRADLATLTVNLSRQDGTPAAAARRTALAVDSIRRGLAALGVPADSVVNASRWWWWHGRVEVVQVNQRSVMVPDYDANGRPAGAHSELRADSAYRVYETLEIRMRDLTRVGRVIDALLAMKITDIGDVKFSATNTEAAEREAIRIATERARARAEVMAAAAGGRLGRTLRVSTVAEGGGDRYGFGIAAGTAVNGDGAGRGATVVVAPVIEVGYTVTGRWQFVESR